jgi:hypothetical protein
MVYQVVAVGDPFRGLYQITFETGTGDLAQRFDRGVRVMTSLALPLGVALVGVSLAAWKWRMKPFGSVLVVTLGALAFAQSAGAVAVQVPASYSTRYRYGYGYDDLRATIDDVRAAGGYALAIKDVLYYAGVPGEDAYSAVCGGCSAQALIDKIKSQHVSSLVWTSKEETRFSQVVENPALRHILETCYSRKTHGVFIVHMHRPDVVCW